MQFIIKLCASVFVRSMRSHIMYLFFASHTVARSRRRRCSLSASVSTHPCCLPNKSVLVRKAYHHRKIGSHCTAFVCACMCVRVFKCSRTCWCIHRNQRTATAFGNIRNTSATCYKIHTETSRCDSRSISIHDICRYIECTQYMWIHSLAKGVVAESRRICRRTN